MGISTVNPYNTQTKTFSPEIVKESEIGVLDKNAFLKMLLTQLQNQDPLNPMDNTEFSAQMAQFSTLEQMSNMNEQLSQLSSIGKQLEEILGLLKGEKTQNENSSTDTNSSTDAKENTDELSKIAIKYNFNYNNSNEIEQHLKQSLSQFFMNKLY